jgi:hypothetical protein
MCQMDLEPGSGYLDEVTMTNDEPADILNEQWHRYVAARNEALAARSPRAARSQPDELDGTVWHTESLTPNDIGS